MIVRALAATLGFAALGLLAPAVLAAAAASDAQELDARRQRIFGLTCAHCHARPGIGVPQLGDEREWSERRRAGLEALLARTVVGSGGMPPLGTCGFCSEDDLRALVAYLAGVGAGEAE